MDKRIHPCLWFDGQARAAAEFYCATFPNAHITADNGMVVNWEIDGQKFMGLNGGPHFQFNEAVSFVVPCADQAEIDHFWEAFTRNGGQESQCGWCKDRFGVSWQVIPAQLGEWMSDPERAPRVMAAFLKMRKFDIQTLLDA